MCYLIVIVVFVVVVLVGWLVVGVLLLCVGLGGIVQVGQICYVYVLGFKYMLDMIFFVDYFDQWVLIDYIM